MRSTLIAAFLLALLAAPAFPATLKEMYDKAPSAHGFDRYIELETGVTYTGGLYIGRTFNRITAEFEGDNIHDVRIVGNGAVLDLRCGEICISYCNRRLDIDDCVVLNGNIRYRGYEGGSVDYKPQGSVRYVTFYKPHDYGVRIYGCGDGITIERNIFVDAVDTGPDFLYLTGYASDWLPTGSSVAFSGLGYGIPDPKDNWSYHGDPAANGDPLRHFAKLCEYG